MSWPLCFIKRWYYKEKLDSDRIKTDTIPVSPLWCWWREDCLGSVKLQWPRVASVGKEKQAKLKKANKQPKKKKPVAVPLDLSPERRTMTMIPEISARGSLIPAATLGPLLSFGYRGSEGGSCRPLNHMRQSHSKSCSKSPVYPYVWIRRIYIWRFSHWVILVVRIY